MISLDAQWRAQSPPQHAERVAPASGKYFVLIARPWPGRPADVPTLRKSVPREHQNNCALDPYSCSMGSHHGQERNHKKTSDRDQNQTADKSGIELSREH